MMGFDVGIGDLILMLSSLAIGLAIGWASRKGRD